jgi:hypothetical protein
MRALPSRVRSEARFNWACSRMANGAAVLGPALFSDFLPGTTSRYRALSSCQELQLSPVNPSTARDKKQKREEAPEERPRSIGTRLGPGGPTVLVAKGRRSASLCAVLQRKVLQATFARKNGSRAVRHADIPNAICLARAGTHKTICLARAGTHKSRMRFL